MHPKAIDKFAILNRLNDLSLCFFHLCVLPHLYAIRSLVAQSLIKISKNKHQLRPKIELPGHFAMLIELHTEMNVND